MISIGTSFEESITLHLSAASGNNTNRPGNNSFKGKNNGYGGARGPNRDCTHSNRTNHTFETCFLKYGYPTGFKSKGKSPPPNSHSQSVAFVEIGQASPS